MIKKIFFVIVFLSIGSNTFAQIKSQSQDTIKKNKKIYILEFTNRNPFITKNLILDPKKVADLSSPSNESNAELSRLLKVDFVVVVKFEPGTTLLTLNEVLKIYKLNTDYWNLPVRVDDEIIDDPQTLLIARNQIAKVLIKKGAASMYINIIRI